MRTPPLGRRATLGGSVVVAVVLIAFDAFVYLSLRDGLEGGLDDLLAARLDVAANLARDTEPEVLADRLATLGVPATVEAADGRRFVGAPATPRIGAVGPATVVAHPRVARATALPGGGTIEVYATRAGTDTTLRRLLAVSAVGTLLAVALAYLLLRRVTARALAPLDEVASTAERISAGAIGERLAPDSATSELGRMATAFDMMLDSLEEALARATAEEGRTRRFMADATHQLRTPITGIRAAAELLLQEEDPEVRDRLIAGCVRETARAGRLITGLLQMARLDRAGPPTRVPTDIVELCEGELERAQGLAPHLDIDLAGPSTPTAPLPIAADEVRDALANLIDNARRHARQAVRVTVDQDDAFVTIQVADDGPGVPEGAEDLVFERFSTLDSNGGSGLGLPIARGVARAHGGDVTYEDGRFVLRLSGSP